MTKRSLITISHAIEQAAVAAVATQDEPVVLIAMFQRPLYFDRERVAYRRLATSATLTIVGLVDVEPDVPPGVEGIAVHPDDPLSAEWSVIMLTPRAGAALVALDRQEIIPGESSIEKGRLFNGWYSFDRRQAQAQVARLHASFGDRLSRRADIIIQEVLDEANSRRANPSEERTGAAISLFVQQLEASNTRVRQLEAELAAAGKRGGRDPLTGLRDRSWLSDWIGPGAATASDTFSVALILIDVNRLRDVNQWYGKNTGDEVLKRLATIVTQPLRDVDHAVRLTDDDILVILPGMTAEQAMRMAYSFCADIATMRLHDVSSNGGVTATAAVTTTAQRPLPIAELRRSMAEAKANRFSVVQLSAGQTASGDGAPQSGPRADLGVAVERGGRGPDLDGPATSTGGALITPSVMFTDSTRGAVAT